MYTIGIAGGSGSGKSTFADQLKARYGAHIATLSCDSYYLPHEELTFDERKQLNFDAPEALDIPLMVAHIRALRAGESIDHPVYNFKTHTRDPETVHLDPPDILILDGILLYHFDDLRVLIDLKVYVDTDADERILRRAHRDMRERERTLPDIIAQYLATVKPMHERYVEPTKKYADIILPGGGNPSALCLIAAQLDRYLADKA